MILISIGLGVYNLSNHHELEPYNKFFLSAILLGLLIIFFFLPRRIKGNFLSVCALILSLILLFESSLITHKIIEEQRLNSIYSEYSQLSCDELKKRFEIDLKDNDLKYFSGGMFHDLDWSEILKENDITELYQGCMVNLKLECYSDLVNDYLEKEKNINIKELYQ